MEEALYPSMIQKTTLRFESSLQLIKPLYYAHEHFRTLKYLNICNPVRVCKRVVLILSTCLVTFRTIFKHNWYSKTRTSEKEGHYFQVASEPLDNLYASVQSCRFLYNTLLNESFGELIKKSTEKLILSVCSQQNITGNRFNLNKNLNFAVCKNN